MRKDTFKGIGKLRYFIPKILPLVYDNSLSYYEVLEKAIQKINELVNNFNDWYAENGITVADPIEWDITKQYKAFTIVKGGDGTLYISVAPVPSNITLDDREYWEPLFSLSDLTKYLQDAITAYNTDGFIKSGHLFWNNDVLYEALKDIPEGGEITEDNARPITIDEKLNNIQPLNFCDELIPERLGSWYTPDTEPYSSQQGFTKLKGNLAAAYIIDGKGVNKTTGILRIFDIITGTIIKDTLIACNHGNSMCYDGESRLYILHHSGDEWNTSGTQRISCFNIDTYTIEYTGFIQFTGESSRVFSVSYCDGKLSVYRLSPNYVIKGDVEIINNNFVVNNQTPMERPRHKSGTFDMITCAENKTHVIGLGAYPCYLVLWNKNTYELDKIVHLGDTYSDGVMIAEPEDLTVDDDFNLWLASLVCVNSSNVAQNSGKWVICYGRSNIVKSNALFENNFGNYHVSSHVYTYYVSNTSGGGYAGTGKDWRNALPSIYIALCTKKNAHRVIIVNEDDTESNLEVSLTGHENLRIRFNGNNSSFNFINLYDCRGITLDNLRNIKRMIVSRCQTLFCSGANFTNDGAMDISQTTVFFIGTAPATINNDGTGVFNNFINPVSPSIFTNKLTKGTSLTDTISVPSDRISYGTNATYPQYYVTDFDRSKMTSAANRNIGMMSILFGGERVSLPFSFNLSNQPLAAISNESINYLVYIRFVDNKMLIGLRNPDKSWRNDITRIDYNFAT